jgi:OmpA-OmpF porin, OOP family
MKPAPCAPSPEKNPFHLALLSAIVATPFLFAGCAPNELCTKDCGLAAADSDGDGVPDDRDKCPDTPRGVSVDADGCPIDSDGDGVPDYLDKCPRTPKGVEVDANGCPLPGPFAFQNVYFMFDSARITPEGVATLDESIGVLRSRPALVLNLQGHASSEGTDEYNLALSQRRANAVQDYLVSNGISGDRLETTGYGESRPDATNATEEGREKNRRVEFIILNR